jgi:hypothetical protein
MQLVIELITLLLVTIAVATALAHALEFPGKRRLDESSYLAVQTIYYPGFTIAGLAEPLGAIATFALFFTLRSNPIASRLTLTAFAALISMHVIFWIVTQPANKFWLRKQRLGPLGQRFFSSGRGSAASAGKEPVESEAASQDWQRMRDRWEYSHIARAFLSVTALVTLNAAVLVNSR